MVDHKKHDSIMIIQRSPDLLKGGSGSSQKSIVTKSAMGTITNQFTPSLMRQKDVTCDDGPSRSVILS